MSRKKGRLPALECDHLVMRFVDRNSAAGEFVVIATDTPIERYDEARGYVIREVLLMDGCEFRGGRSQIPIVDSHDDKTVRNIFGSIVRMKVDAATGELSGTPSFATDEEAQVIARRFEEGHINDFSITAMPKDGFFVPSGQTYTTPRGVVVEGPAEIITRWQPHNASICATGADEKSTVRRSYTDLKRRINRMDEALMGQLSGLGIPEGMTDPNQVIAFLAGKLAPPAEAESSAEPIENMEDTEEEKPEPVENMESTEAEEPAAATEEEVDRMDDEEKKNVERSAAEQERKRIKEIYAMCTKGRLERAFADQLVNEGVSLEIARERTIERMSTTPLGQTAEARVAVTESADDKFYAAVRDGLIQRAFRSAGVRQSAFSDGQKAAPGASDFANARLSRVAEQFAERMGCDVRRMASKDIALVAMGQPAALSRYRIQRDAYHSSGSFPNLLLDASNKTLLAGYEEAPYTWSMWARQAGSVDDFKNINRIRFSEMASPEMVPENHDYPESQMSDAKEVYKVEKYGSVFTITWETVVNDDLDAISRIPAMQGAACRRKQNAAVYGVLTANAAMADGGALFNATAQTTTGGHANLAGSSAAPSVTTLNAGFVSMMTKKGLNSSVTLNIQPSFLIVPAALSATALQLVGSVADPAAGGSSAGNSNTKNIYGPNADRPLRVVVDPVLDASSSTSWYLAAQASQVDTVELSFLAGEETPVLENEWDFDKDVYKYKVRQTFGVAAIDFRGLYKNAG